jgi:hypothetical protein
MLSGKAIKGKKKEMIKKLLIGTLAFAAGLATSILAESELRQLIRTLFRKLTNNAIHFYGKDFHLFASSYYYLSFAFIFLIIWISCKDHYIKENTKTGLMVLVIFFLSIVMLSLLDSNGRIAECTACQNGIRRIHYNDINYDAIICISLWASIIPVGLRQIKLAREKNSISEQRA